MHLLSKTQSGLRWYSSVLRDFASKGSLKEGKAIHGHLVKDGVEVDSHLWVSLINMYCKCRNPVLARRVLDEMPERDVVSWNAVIAGYVAEGSASDAVSLFCKMKKEDIKPNEFAMSTVLKACSLCLNLKFGKQLHADAIKFGLCLDLYVGSGLVDVYAKCDKMELADRVFFSMPELSTVSLNVLLNGYAEKGDIKNILRVFCGIRHSELKFNNFIISTIMKGCANSGSIIEGKVLHSLVIKTGLKLDQRLGCSLLDMYSKCRLACDALIVFKMIKDPDIVAWSAMITCLAQQGQIEEAAEMLHAMRFTGTRPNHFTIASLVSAASDLCDLRYGESLHAFILKSGFESDNVVCNSLFTMYIRKGNPQDGRQVFYAMEVCDVASWNALLSAYHNFEHLDERPRIFQHMLVNGIEPDMDTFDGVLRYCSNFLDVTFGTQLHAHILKNDLAAQQSVGTALFDMYIKNSCLEDADVVISRLINHDIVTWTTIITSYVQTDQVEKAFRYFNKMQRDGLQPNEFTLATCLSGCSRVASMVNGQQLHSLAIKAGHLGDLFFSTALVDMYGKCGCIEDAEVVFQSLVSQDVISWNTMINVYSQHMKGAKALETFQMMLDEYIEPDEVTFMGVLTGCSRIGLIEEGKRQFISMEKVYGITPTAKHYACMVDILGRAGKFNEVESFIKEMKLAPYPLIWESLLGACSLHGNVELGEKAARILFELEPMIDVNYILLSNIYAAKGQWWDDVKKVRALMSSRRVKKELGCSWVEVNGQVHVFMSGNGSHPKMREIYRKLEELDQKLASVGYKPKIEYSLHDASDTEKIDNLYYHSGRLALAFALISTNPNKTVRIFKNLNICRNCHDVVKLISGITSREILVRDTKYFHHFKSGTCSCHNYW